MTLIDLNDVTLRSAPKVGGKAASLGELLNIGVNVPPGFIILPTTDLSEETSNILNKFDDLGVKTVAVRSSASLEDGQDMSFAGQFDTYLHVKRDELIDKIRACQNSSKNDRLHSYLAQNNLSADAVQVAVIVQTMVEPSVAGVAFSKNPITNNEDEIIIEAAYGLGEAIVSGKVTPDQYTIDKSGNIKEIQIGQQTSELKYEGQAIKELPVAADRQANQKLNETQLSELLAVVSKIESHYKYAVDVEWAYSENNLYILQARPITT